MIRVMTDIWLTGPVPGDHPRLMPVVHSLRDGLAAEIHDRLDGMRACGVPRVRKGSVRSVRLQPDVRGPAKAGHYESIKVRLQPDLTRGS